VSPDKYSRRDGIHRFVGGPRGFLQVSAEHSVEVHGIEASNADVDGYEEEGAMYSVDWVEWYKVESGARFVGDRAKAGAYFVAEDIVQSDYMRKWDFGRLLEGCLMEELLAIESERRPLQRLEVHSATLCRSSSSPFPLYLHKNQIISGASMKLNRKRLRGHTFGAQIVQQLHTPEEKVGRGEVGGNCWKASHFWSRIKLSLGNEQSDPQSF
jgi:hypothetical protein